MCVDMCRICVTFYFEKDNKFPHTFPLFGEHHTIADLNLPMFKNT